MDSTDRQIAVIALSQLKGVTGAFLQLMRERNIQPEEFIRQSNEEKGTSLGLAQMPCWRDSDIAKAVATATAESRFCIEHNIKVLSPCLDGFPRRLDILQDPPRCLFMLGDTDLDATHILSIVGTRKVTQQGARFCSNFVGDISSSIPDAVIVSGLAYGTDAEAHKAALENRLPTVGVLAHGLGMIYPAAHRQLAKRIVSNGGALITEYLSSTQPYRGQFLERNRIIAALSDGVMVVESAIKGGAMSTAAAALDFDRIVMAMPGRRTDAMSEGCNMLIRHMKAILTCDAHQACDSLGWKAESKSAEIQQPTLFKQPSEELRPLYDILQQSQEPIGIDTLMVITKLSLPRLTTMLFLLEEDGFVTRLPNNRYGAI